MSRNGAVSVVFNQSDLNKLIRECRRRKTWLREKSEELAKRLAEEGYQYASIVMSEHIFNGETLASLRVEKTGEYEYTVMANSTAVLFLEFGSGVFGYGHPEAGENGMGPGTYPGQTHAFNPAGWMFETDDPRLIVKYDKNGKGLGHSYGMPPAMPMYKAVTGVEQDLERIVKEVFAS